MNPVRIALQRKRPVLQMRQQKLGDRVVIVQQIALRIAVFGIVKLIEIRELEAVPIDCRWSLLCDPVEENRAAELLHG